MRAAQVELGERIDRRGKRNRGAAVCEQHPAAVGTEIGTFKRVFEAFYEMTAFLALRPNTQAAYRQVIKRALKLKSKEGRALSEYRLKALTRLGSRPAGCTSVWSTARRARLFALSISP